MIISAYLVKMVFLFSANKISPFCLKSKNDLLPKNTHEDDIPSITDIKKKNDIHSRKYGISSNRKIKDDKKVSSYKYELVELV